MSDGPSAPQAIQVVLVVAASENNIIGKDGGLPWSLPDDLKHFKRTTIGRPVIMGRRTFDEIGRRPLPARPNLIVSTTLEPREPGDDPLSVHPSLTDAVDHARKLVLAGDTDAPREICIIGGGQIYRQALPLATHIVLTRVHAEIKGDTVFPEIPAQLWRLDQAEHHGTDDRHAHAFTFEWWSRR